MKNNANARGGKSGGVLNTTASAVFNQEAYLIYFKKVELLKNKCYNKFKQYILKIS